MKPLQFSHQMTVYVFRGKALNPPAPGTYDSAKWTPPTHQVFAVEIQDDGMWCIKLGGVQIHSGDYAKRSRAAAEELILKHCQRLLEN